MRKLKQGSDPHIGAAVWDREAFEAVGEWSSWSVTLWMEWESHRQYAIAIYTIDRDISPLESTVAGSWDLGMEDNPRVRSAVDCGADDQGDVREETVEGNACGGKLGSRGGKAILLSLAWGWGHHCSLSLSPHSSWTTEKESRESGHVVPDTMSKGQAGPSKTSAKIPRKEQLKTHYMRPPSSPWYQNQTKTIQKRKIKVNITK